MAGIMPSVPHIEPFNGSAAIKQPFQAPPPFYIRQEAKGMGHTGGLNSSVMGRTDHLPIAAPAGSHVIPADVVSGLGQGNTQAGMGVLNHMFNSGPYGVGLNRMKSSSLMRPPAAPKAPSPTSPMTFAAGGTVPTMMAGGEYVVPPETVAAIGGGDPEHGHDILDAFIGKTRAETVKTLQTLPGPKK